MVAGANARACPAPLDPHHTQGRADHFTAQPDRMAAIATTTRLPGGIAWPKSDLLRPTLPHTQENSMRSKKDLRIALVIPVIMVAIFLSVPFVWAG